MKIISVDTLTKLIGRHGLEAFSADLIAALRRDFGRWDDFELSPRHTIHVPGGVMELMPVCDQQFHAFKYVNCHPANPKTGQLTVVATGQLARIDTGYPLMISEMTLLTALRTAATAALATDLMARANSQTLAIIGTGAQSEFQVLAVQQVRRLTQVRYFDLDPAAMNKFERNLEGAGLEMIRCTSAEEAVQGADIVTVCTAAKARVSVLQDVWVKAGMHINALGGDCPGKTELEAATVKRSRITTEFFDQAQVEGEIQVLEQSQARSHIHAELRELVTGAKRGREHASDITLFDGVGIALEDYSALRLTYELAERYGLGDDINLIPSLTDPKDLVSVLTKKLALQN